MAPWESIFAVAGVVVLAGVRSAEGLQCFQCLTYSASSDCALHPESVAVIDCSSYPYCDVRRAQYHDGTLSWMMRGCSDSSQGVINGSITNDFGVVHYYQCGADLCNDGDGFLTSVLQCYACETYDASSACAVDPASLEDGAVACGGEFDFCAIERAELNGNFRSLKRQCASGSQLPVLNGTTTQQTADGMLVTHYMACDIGRCNDGDGVVIDPPAPTPDLECHVCWSDDPASDCVLHPENVDVRDCSAYPYCAIRRGNMNGAFSWISRGCSDGEEAVLNGSVTIGTEVIYYYHCATDLCNSGGGILLECYTCDTNDASSACAVDSANVQDGVVLCGEEHEFCAIEREELHGTFHSLKRLCVSRGELPVLNGTTTQQTMDGRLVTHYTACDLGLCNDGDGVAIGPPTPDLQCHVCWSADPESDCILHPENVDVRDCSTYSYCAIRRGEVNGEFSWLSRGCSFGEDGVLNGSMTTGAEVIYYYHCSADLCNDGDGVVFPPLECYSCNTDEAINACVADPANVHEGIVVCGDQSELCMTERVELDGNFRSLKRQCASGSQLPVMNGTTTQQTADGMLVKHYMACDIARCNNGDGIVIKQDD